MHGELFAKTATSIFPIPRRGPPHLTLSMQRWRLFPPLESGRTLRFTLTTGVRPTWRCVVSWVLVWKDLLQLLFWPSRIPEIRLLSAPGEAFFGMQHLVVREGQEATTPAVSAIWSPRHGEVPLPLSQGNRFLWPHKISLIRDQTTAQLTWSQQHRFMNK